MCTPGTLNRSCSESDLSNLIADNNIAQYDSCEFDARSPYVRKRIVFVEQIIHRGSQELLRSSSCNLVIDSVSQSRPEDFHFRNFTKNFDKPGCDFTPLTKRKIQAITSYDNNGVTPMEVDNIYNDDSKIEDCVDIIEPMDMDRSESLNRQYHDLGKVLKKRTVPPPPPPTFCRTSESNLVHITTRQKLKVLFRSYFNIKLVIIVVPILLYILLIQGNTIYVNSDVQLENIQKDLLEEVHEQKDSINVIVRSLKQRSRWESKIKVLGFVGPTGVGKTHIANILKKHFHIGLIHELFGFQLNYKSQWDHILNDLKGCCLNLIIVDDLNKKDAANLFALVHSIPPNKFTLVISIFNIQHTDDKLNYGINYEHITEIRKEFDNSGLYNELIVFQEFNRSQVKHWVERQLRDRNVEDRSKEELVNSVLKGHNVKYHGLKGLYSKLLLELEKYSQ